MIPVVGIRGRLSGFNFYTRGTYLYVDVIKRGDDPLAELSQADAGPRQVRVRGDQPEDVPPRRVGVHPE